MPVFVRSEQSWILSCISTMAPFFINHFQGSTVERICCDSESSTNAKEKHRCDGEVHVLLYRLRRFSAASVQDSETQQINSTLKPRTGFMKNGTITNMHQRVQLRSDLTNPYVKLFSFKKSIRNPRLSLFPETKQNHICRCLWNPNKAGTFCAYPQWGHSS